jgi:hypothetical protein
MNTHNHAVAVVVPTSRHIGARLSATVAKALVPLLAALVLAACAPIPPADSPQAGAAGASQHRPAHWEVDGLQRTGNHGTRQR